MRIPKEDMRGSFDFAALAIGSGSFFLTQTLLLLLLAGTYREGAKRLLPWQFALGAALLIGMGLLCWALRRRLRNASESSNRESDSKRGD
ncbi:MAG: hypothetical protein JW941_13555 [Candidatus Coatesbacteria bacterium]|nr:hypothetical protein [Candidatus Coatesbacteria bacterium]